MWSLHKDSFKHIRTRKENLLIFSPMPSGRITKLQEFSIMECLNVKKIK